VKEPSQTVYLIQEFSTVPNSLDILCGLVVDFLATDPEVRVRFPALPDFLRSSGSGTGSTRPRECN
jgi:hypothetical protein